MKLTDIDKQNIWHPFSPLPESRPIPVKSAKGIYLHTSDGRKILDAISSWWVNIHGHANKKVAKAIAKQAHRLEQVIFAGFTHQPAVKLSKGLKEVLPADQSKLFFSDNGSTSTEVALKLAIQYWHNLGKSRKKVIAIDGAYHGDTFGAMSVGERGIFNQPFADLLFDVSFVPFPEGDGQNAIKSMKELASEDVAAFIFEPLVQGASGMKMYEPSVLDQLIEIARSHNIICIADEVMTGFGRTGRLFACDYLENKPDIFCLSKGLTAGFLPMGITTMNERITSAFDVTDRSKAFFHGHSYTANPMACAAANASLKILRKKKTLANIARIEKAHQNFVDQFPKVDRVFDVRHRGTILAIELKADDPGYTSDVKEEIYSFFLERDLLLRPLGNVIYLIPPYIITNEELGRIYDAIMEFFNQNG